MVKPLWQPGADAASRTHLANFMRQAEKRHDLRFGDYWDFDRWAAENSTDFWALLWDFAGVVAETRGDVILNKSDRMPGAEWFPDARLNYAENLLRRRDDAIALVFWGED